jgi:hypothetical protein
MKPDAICIYIGPSISREALFAAPSFSNKYLKTINLFICIIVCSDTILTRTSEMSLILNFHTEISIISIVNRRQMHKFDAHPPYIRCANKLRHCGPILTHSESGRSYSNVGGVSLCMQDNLYCCMHSRCASSDRILSWMHSRCANKPSQ